MYDWFLLSLIALVGYGIQAFLFKVAAQRKLSSVRVNSVFMLTVAILAGIVYMPKLTPVNSLFILVIAALGNGTTFLLGNICKIQSLKKIPLILSYPVSKMYVALTPIFTFFIFTESVSPLQLTGIILAVLVVLILSREGRKDRMKREKIKTGLILAGLAAFLISASNVFGKYAAINVDIIQFMLLAYSYTFILSLLIQIFAFRENPVKNLLKDRKSLKIGSLIGVINFFSYFILLNALSQGPATVIYPLIGLSLVVAVILTILVYKEKITFNRIIALVLTLVAIVLLR